MDRHFTVAVWNHTGVVPERRWGPYTQVEAAEKKRQLDEICKHLGWCKTVTIEVIE